MARPQPLRVPHIETNPELAGEGIRRAFDGAINEFGQAREAKRLQETHDQDMLEKKLAHNRQIKTQGEVDWFTEKGPALLNAVEAGEMTHESAVAQALKDGGAVAAEMTGAAIESGYQLDRLLAQLEESETGADYNRARSVALGREQDREEKYAEEMQAYYDKELLPMIQMAHDDPSKIATEIVPAMREKLVSRGVMTSAQFDATQRATREVVEASLVFTEGHNQLLGEWMAMPDWGFRAKKIAEDIISAPSGTAKGAILEKGHGVTPEIRRAAEAFEKSGFKETPESALFVKQFNRGGIFSPEYMGKVSERNMLQGAAYMVRAPDVRGNLKIEITDGPDGREETATWEQEDAKKSEFDEGGGAATGGDSLNLRGGGNAPQDYNYPDEGGEEPTDTQSAQKIVDGLKTVKNTDERFTAAYSVTQEKAQEAMRALRALNPGAEFSTQRIPPSLVKIYVKDPDYAAKRRQEQGIDASP